MKYIPRKRFRKWWTRSGTYEYRWRVNWLDFRHCSYIYHSPRVFHPLAMLSTSQKDTPFSCLAMVGLNSLLVRAVARTYNSPSWTRHAFLRLISNSLSRRCTVYTSLIITWVRFYLITITVIEPCIARENLVSFWFTATCSLHRTIFSRWISTTNMRYDQKGKKDLEWFQPRWCYNFTVSAIFQTKFMKTSLCNHSWIDIKSLLQNYKIANFQGK